MGSRCSALNLLDDCSKVDQLKEVNPDNIESVGRKKEKFVSFAAIKSKVKTPQIDAFRVTIMVCWHRRIHRSTVPLSETNHQHHYPFNHSTSRNKTIIFSNNPNSSYALRMFYDNRNDNVDGNDGSGDAIPLHRTPFLNVNYMQSEEDARSFTEHNIRANVCLTSCLPMNAMVVYANWVRPGSLGGAHQGGR